MNEVKLQLLGYNPNLIETQSVTASSLDNWTIKQSATKKISDDGVHYVHSIQNVLLAFVTESYLDLKKYFTAIQIGIRLIPK